MKWKNIKIGWKMGFGFGFLIVVALLIGSVALVNMSAIGVESEYLAKEYVPELEIANNVERNFLGMMFDLRAYNYTSETSFLKSGQAKLRDVHNGIKDAYALADKADRLVKLEGLTKSIDENVTLYEELLNQTITVVENMEQAKDKMDEAAEKYMQNCNAFLESQNSAMLREINTGNTSKERLDKITYVNNLIDAGAALRLENFKGQALRKPEALVNAVKEFEKSNVHYNQLRQITRQQVNLIQIDAIEKAGQDYTNAVAVFSKNWNEKENLGSLRVPAADVANEHTQAAALAALNGTMAIADNVVSIIGQSRMLMLTIFIIGILLGVTFAVFVTRSITVGIIRGVAKEVEFASAIASGDLTFQIDKSLLAQTDEIGQLANALQDMSNALKPIVTNILDGAENIASASQELSSTSQQMSQGSAEQASSAEEVSSSMEEMASNIQQNTDNAKQTEKISLKASDDIGEGNAAVEQTVSSMKILLRRLLLLVK